jgi:hypothetical protein
MRAAAAAAACALLVAAGCGGGGGEAITTGTTGTGESGATGATGTTGGDGTPTCTEKAGEVVDLLPVAQRGCSKASLPVETGDALFGGTELATESVSALKFDLELASSGTAHCGMSSDAAALIRPDADTDLEVIDGSVSCDVPSAATFAAPGAKVDVTGTLLSFTAEGDTTTIRLYDGTIDVHSTADGSTQQMSAPVGAGASCPTSASQAVVSTSEPLQPKEYSLDPSELATTAIVKLRVGLVPPGALQGLAAGMSESKATVVTATEDQKAALLDRNLVRQVPLVTVAALREPPGEQPIQPGETVVGVGEFTALFPTFCRIRGDVPDSRLLYTPFAFSSGGTTSTGTESGTSSTETETTSTETPTESTPP